MATTTAAVNDARKASLAYLESGDDDSVYELIDGTPVLVSSTQHELDYTHMEVTLSMTAIREAFVISAFHYWEKWARSLTNLNDRRDHFWVLKNRLARDYTIHPSLGEINRLTNVLKHGSGAFEHARSLAKVRPDLFSRLPNLYGDWTVSVSEEHVRQVFEVISCSGPR
ncbi:hypothetical protein ACIGGE_10755 [Qipengyuania sp. NPDC077410]|uniref:hypothetical protein n=1 Tax=Qipengyuania sp. NPDC077410 TaxID=3364496 RepID=UPI0037C82B60